MISSGSWNSAHSKSPAYDALVQTDLAALDVDAKRKVASSIQTMLLDETPLIIAYFYDYLMPRKKNLKGAAPIAERMFLKDCYFG